MSDFFKTVILDSLFTFSDFVKLLIYFHIHDRRINVEIKLF